MTLSPPVRGLTSRAARINHDEREHSTRRSCTACQCPRCCERVGGERGLLRACARARGTRHPLAKPARFHAATFDARQSNRRLTKADKCIDSSRL